MNYEFEILYWFQSLHNPVLDKIMVFFSGIGNAGIIWIAITALMFIICKKSKKAAWTSLAALLLSLIVVNLVLKNTVARPRPCWIDTDIKLLVSSPKDFSFPSGHTSASFASAVSIFYYYRKPGIAAIILAALIAVSRMYLFVHFPTDVLCGAVLGVAEAVVAIFLVKYVYKKYVEI